MPTVGANAVARRAGDWESKWTVDQAGGYDWNHPDCYGFCTLPNVISLFNFRVSK